MESARKKDAPWKRVAARTVADDWLKFSEEVKDWFLKDLPKNVALPRTCSQWYGSPRMWEMYKEGEGVLLDPFHDWKVRETGLLLRVREPLWGPPEEVTMSCGGINKLFVATKQPDISARDTGGSNTTDSRESGGYRSAGVPENTHDNPDPSSCQGTPQISPINGTNLGSSEVAGNPEHSAGAENSDIADSSRLPSGVTESTSVRDEHYGTTVGVLCATFRKTRNVPPATTDSPLFLNVETFECMIPHPGVLLHCIICQQAVPTTELHPVFVHCSVRSWMPCCRGCKKSLDTERRLL